MDQEHEVYAEDYKALKEILKHYPAIQIISVEKQPPEQYIIEYKVFGYGYKEDGSVQMARRHRVEINLPFGYPHFPPTVKPITSICHPDVDENAVRIADYWQRKPSLADLVVHIADMIRGEVYSKDGVFNPDAVAWYEQNAEKLPLAELEYVDDPDAAAKQISSGREFSVKPIAIGLMVLLVIVGGGVLLRDFMVLNKTAVERLQLDLLMDERKFSLAQEKLQNAIDSLGGIIILGSQKDTRLQKLQDILESPRLQEGLQGRVEVNGEYVQFEVAEARVRIEKLKQLAAELAVKGDLVSAVRYYGDAERLAEENGLSEAVKGVKKASVNVRLDYYLGLANDEYALEGWQEAGRYYGQVVDILKNEKEYLTEEQLSTLQKLEKLRVLALANYHKEQANRLERVGRFKESADNYRAIASIVRRSEFPDEPVLAALNEEAEKEAARVEERILISASRVFLLENYKEIFKKHYPGLHVPALQSPRAKYIGRSGGNLVFAMSCIELIQRNSNEYRLYYQFDPVAEEWSLYRERK